jgi:hypothetical protein
MSEHAACTVVAQYLSALAGSDLDARTPHRATTFLMTEWNTVPDGRVESALLVFDTAAGAQLHAGGQRHDS